MMVRIHFDARARFTSGVLPGPLFMRPIIKSVCLGALLGSSLLAQEVSTAAQARAPSGTAPAAAQGKQKEPDEKEEQRRERKESRRERRAEHRRHL